MNEGLEFVTSVSFEDIYAECMKQVSPEYHEVLAKRIRAALIGVLPWGAFSAWFHSEKKNKYW